MKTFRSGCSVAKNSKKRAVPNFEVEYAEFLARNGKLGGRKANPLEFATIVPPAFLVGRKWQARL
jgi:hypothetical protein